MAEAALARREARRRKILENSHNRLQLISGKSDADTTKGSPILTPISVQSFSKEFSSNESSSINNCYLNNGIINTVEEPIDFQSTNRENLAIGDGDAAVPNHDFAAFLSNGSSAPEPTVASPPLLEKLLNCKYDIVVLSLFIQMLHSFSLLSFENTYFFLPLALYVTTKNFWFPRQTNSYIANAILLLNGMSSSRVQKILSITQYVSTFLQDVCIFLFTTICIQSLCHIVKDSFV